MASRPLILALAKSVPEIDPEQALAARPGTVSATGRSIQSLANLLIMLNQDAANIAFNMLEVLVEGMVVGPILLGAAPPKGGENTSKVV
jgi:malate dehydrogenase (oxaloacetate-decarboxylating)(NADP+)